MIETAKDAILINAYWFSLVLIGFVLLRLMMSVKQTPKNLKSVARFALKQNIFVVVLACFTATAFACAVVSLPLYIFNAPVKLLVILYVGILALSCVYVAVLILQHLWDKRDIDILGLKNQTLFTKILVLIMLAALIIDYVLALYIKSNVTGDTVYHMSRVVDILSTGFNTQTSFFSNLKDGAYHYNVIYALYAVPSVVLHLEPIRVWEYSLGFYRLMEWLSIFTLGLYVFRDWLKAKAFTLPLAVVGLISAMAFFGQYFFIATYPNQIVNIWLTLLVICLALRDKKPFVYVAILALSLLITMTHPTYALIAASFIMLLAVTRVAIEKKKFLKNKAVTYLYGASIILLMAGPLVTKLTPNNINSDQIHLSEPILLNVLGMHMKNPIDALPTSFISWFGLVCAIIAILFLLFKLWKRQSEWSVAFSVLLFFPIVVYIPFTFTLLYHVLPFWVIDRFSAMNVLVYLYIPIALWSIFLLVGAMLKRAKIGFNEKYIKLASIIFVFLIFTMSAFGSLDPYKVLTADRKFKKDTYQHMEQTIKDFKSILKNEKVVLADKGNSYYLASMFPIDVLAVEYGHSPLSADTTNRLRCQDKVILSFLYADLKAIGASYVVLTTYEVKHPEGSSIDTKPYLKRIAQNEDFSVYQFIRDQHSPAESDRPYAPCTMYQKTEK